MIDARPHLDGNFYCESIKGINMLSEHVLLKDEYLDYKFGQQEW